MPLELSLEDRKAAALREIGETLKKYGFEIGVQANAVLVPNEGTTTAQTGTEAELVV